MSNIAVNLVALQTILHREVTRILRIWIQTLLPTPITITLYFLIFGQVIGQRLGLMDGLSYIDFLVPGLLMLGVVNNAYANVSSSFFSVKFARNIEEMLVSSMSPWVMLVGFCMGGIMRALMVLLIAMGVACIFTTVQVLHPVLFVIIALETAILFSLLGFINGLVAKKFDDVSIVPTFVLTPLIYVGGVFYSIELLPPFWQSVSKLNPIYYVMNGARAAMLGEADTALWLCTQVLSGFTIAAMVLATVLLYKGVGIKE